MIDEDDPVSKSVGCQCQWQWTLKDIQTISHPRSTEQPPASPGPTVSEKMAKIVGLAALGALAMSLPEASAFSAPVTVGAGRSVAAQAASARIPSLALCAAHKTLLTANKAPRAAARNVATSTSMKGYEIDLTGKVSLPPLHALGFIRRRDLLLFPSVVHPR